MDNIIEILASFGIIEVTLATAFGLAINNLLKNFNTLILVPLLNTYVIDLSHVTWGALQVGSFISALLEFGLLTLILVSVLLVTLQPLMEDINEVKNKHEIEQTSLLKDLKQIEEQKKQLLYPTWVS